MDGELWAARMANSKRHHHNFQPSHSSAHLGVWFFRVLVSVGVLNQLPLVWSPSVLGFPSTSESTPQLVILLFQRVFFFFLFSSTVICHHCCCCRNNKQDGYGSLSLTDRWIWVGKRLRVWFIAIEEVGLGVCCWKLRKLCWVFCRSTYFPWWCGWWGSRCCAAAAAAGFLMPILLWRLWHHILVLSSRRWALLWVYTCRKCYFPHLL